jgi:hypothetical protein
MDKSKKWKILSTAQTQLVKFAKLVERIVVPAGEYIIQMPINGGGEIDSIKISGPLGLKTLIPLVESFYAEHGATVRTTKDIAGGDVISALIPSGNHMFDLRLE